MRNTLVNKTWAYKHGHTSCHMFICNQNRARTRRKERYVYLEVLHFQNAKYRENVLHACAQSVGNPTLQAQATLVGGSMSDPMCGGAAAAAAISDPQGLIRQLDQISKNLKFDTISQVRSSKINRYYP